MTETAPLDPSVTANLCMPSFDDFTMLPDDPSFDSLMDPIMSDWPLEDFQSSQTVPMVTQPQTPYMGHGAFAEDFSLFDDSFHTDSMALEQTQTSQLEQPQNSQQATHTRHLHESYEPKRAQSLTASATTHYRASESPRSRPDYGVSLRVNDLSSHTLIICSLSTRLTAGFRKWAIRLHFRITHRIIIALAGF